MSHCKCSALSPLSPSLSQVKQTQGLLTLIFNYRHITNYKCASTKRNSKAPEPCLKHVAQGNRRLLFCNTYTPVHILVNFNRVSYQQLYYLHNNYLVHGLKLFKFQVQSFSGKGHNPQMGD